MRLGLSWEAAPDLPLDDLVEACRRRGLAALELGSQAVLGRPAAGLAELTAIAGDPAAGDVALAAIMAPASDLPGAERVVGACAWLRVPALLPASLGPDDLDHLVDRAAALDGRVLLLHGTDPAEAAALARLAHEAPVGVADLAWQVRPGTDDPALIPDVLGAAGSRLGYVRLLGGGPETHQQTGLGVGPLMGRLTLARFDGPIVLAPSTPAYHQAWMAWLGRAGGWGCGSKQSDPLPLLSLSTAPTTS